MKRGYKEVSHDTEFFSQVDPATVAAVCPHFRLMMEEMVAMAGEAGLRV
jgi:hypothetical protein